MKVVYRKTRELMLHGIVREAEWWVRLTPVESEHDLELELRKPDTDAWLHELGVNREPAEVLLRRAREFPSKIPVVASSLPHLVEEFANTLTSEAVARFVILRDFENPGHQLLRALVSAPPYTYTWHILNHLFPDFGREDVKLERLLAQLFMAQELEFPLDALLDDDRSEHRRCWERAKHYNVRSLRHARQGILTIRAAHFAFEHQLGAKEIADCCGVDARTIQRTLAAVLGNVSIDKASLTMTEITRAAYHHMVYLNGKSLPLPPLPETCFGPLARQREREREREKTDRYSVAEFYAQLQTAL